MAKGKRRIAPQKRRERSAGRRWADSAPRSRRRHLLRFGRGIPPPHLSRGGGRCGGGRASRRSTAAPSFCSAPPLLPLSGSSRETPVAAQGFGHVVSAVALVNGERTSPEASPARGRLAARKARQEGKWVSVRRIPTPRTYGARPSPWQGRVMSRRAERE